MERALYSNPVPRPPLPHSKILGLGIRLFAGISLLVLATVLPINLTGGQVGGVGKGLALAGQHSRPSAECWKSFRDRWCQLDSCSMLAQPK